MNFNADDRELDFEIRDSQLPGQQQKRNVEANLIHWYGFCYSTRFWQYFAMYFLSTFPLFAFYKHFGRSGQGTWSSLIRAPACLLSGFLYSKFGFNTVFKSMMVIQFLVTLTLTIFNLVEAQEERSELFRLVVYRFTTAI